MTIGTSKGRWQVWTVLGMTLKDSHPWACLSWSMNAMTSNMISMPVILWAELNLQQSMPCLLTSTLAPHSKALTVVMVHLAIIWFPATTASSVMMVYRNLMTLSGWTDRSMRELSRTWRDAVSFIMPSIPRMLRWHLATWVSGAGKDR